MAKIVLGIATAHTPLLTLDSDEWYNRSLADRKNSRLSLADGRLVDYDELVKLRGEPYAADATPENYARLAGICQAHLDTLAGALAKANVDVVVIVGDDQAELYRPGNMPAIAVYYGDTILTHPMGEDLPDWMNQVARGYAMDKVHAFPGHAGLAMDIIHGLIDREVDLAIADENPEGRGFGHAFGFPAERLFGGKDIPMIPVMLNTYFPPNVLSPSRCFSVGAKLREAIEASPLDLRVAVLASGGLSHFVVEEELDRTVMGALGDPTGEALSAIPREAMLEGTSEILNWILTAGSVTHLPLKWSAYEPIRRTPAGTGIGCGFAIWSE
ncbi:hypothetical protein [Novosphingobium sp.]|jgi:hypothetical protein|uniref:DODA-type extradiol aromatic ring-opening family dioxygenase n=1 Tax=Novosphingobium sp. TaxID=1874826 RepID=UPI0022C483A7|nr:hypothetical protein [Novosphingobium sp.]MCZ8018662.1 hypothetical protein [Novosphingobium sp.]MCZ8034667.1 hypothetical protein [Novosphingobium sp.]MCZ8052802.1 hypothetical protein [Novosphingobium sp.]MCZ8060560.1 hypothetical protein [Novosphingobium sp.]MCZ8230586.1 hypothetical protein [Novosphingobium sp.]